jgi:hypothetical protein
LEKKVLPPVSTTQYGETSEDMAKLCDNVYSKMDAEYKQMYENSKKRQ